MNLLFNFLWLIFGGLIASISWFLAGVLWCITIIGIPIGLQCFKFAKLCLNPFDKEIIFSNQISSMLLNIIWLLVSGLALAIEFATIGIFLCITIIGIPFGIQMFKLAKLALLPFGSTVR